MDEGQYTPLFERIRERCRQEAQYPEQFSGFEQHAARIRGTTQTPTGLPWPPATEAQLDATEALLHFPLPPLLWRLYAEVGNGGFGPAYGIIGAIGGAPHPDDDYPNIVEGYRQHDEFIELASVPAAQEHGKRFELPHGSWPRYLIPFCSWGCNTVHAVSAQIGAVFTVSDDCSFANWVSSLQDWLEQWLAGTLDQE
jgi:SMI1/KNR4 family protein SUKH-1